MIQRTEDFSCIVSVKVDQIVGSIVRENLIEDLDNIRSQDCHSTKLLDQTQCDNNEEGLVNFRMLWQVFDVADFPATWNPELLKIILDYLDFFRDSVIRSVEFKERFVSFHSPETFMSMSMIVKE